MISKIILIITSLLIYLPVYADTQFQNQVVGGVAVRKGELPFQVSLQFSSGTHFCGGALIKKNWVLTAAHCVQGSSAIKVVVGLLNQSDNQDAEIFSTLKIISHPQFNNTTLDYDYALIQLSANSKFKPIDLNHEELDIPSGNDRLFAWTSGWGTTSEESYEITNLLLKVELPLVSKKLCNSAVAYNGQISDRMLCAGFIGGGKSACQGDSGGPLFIKYAKGNYILVGIGSWSEGCGKKNKFGIYSKINVMVDWINRESQKNKFN